MAQWTAVFLNAFAGGKGDGSEPEKRIPKEQLYTPEEWLPYFAQMNDQQAPSLSVAAAVDIMRNASRIPAWALDLIPFETAKRLTG